MGTVALLDTNIFIYLSKGGLDTGVLNQLKKVTTSGFNLSVISKIELLGYAFPTAYEKNTIEAFVKTATVFALTDDIVDKTIEPRIAHKIKLPDAIIAATALVYNLTLISRNDKDFGDISGLKYFNPFDNFE
jgi:predicted nucleic acid-binding protein